MTQDLAIFKAMSAKMGYLDQRQKVIAQNIANADTPGYRPHDLKAPDFSRALEKVGAGSKMSVSIDSTNKGHMPSPNAIDKPKNQEQGTVYESAPAGNAVIMEEQMIKSSETVMDYNMMTNLYTKHLSMMRTALGGGR